MKYIDSVLFSCQRKTQSSAELNCYLNCIILRLEIKSELKVKFESYYLIIWNTLYKAVPLYLN